MQVSFPSEKVTNPLEALRKAGYAPFRDPKTGSESFVLKLTSGFYPRFHLYIKQKSGKIIFDLHIDQKKPSYSGTRMHAGEYDGSKVEEELRRITGWISHVSK